MITNAIYIYLCNVTATHRAYNRFHPPCLPWRPIKLVIIAVSVFLPLRSSPRAPSTPQQGFGPPTATLPPVEGLSGWAKLELATSTTEDGNAGGSGEQAGVGGAVGGPLEGVGEAGVEKRLEGGLEESYEGNAVKVETELDPAGASEKRGCCIKKYLGDNL